MLRRSNNSYLYERLTPRRTVFPVRDDESAVVVATLRDGNDDVRVRDNRAITGTISDHPSSSSKSSSSHRHVLYRSLCDPDVIPDEARDVTWYDPFFKNDSNIIAAFDMDQRKIEEYKFDSLTNV